MNIPPKYEDVVAQLETERARVTDYIAQRAQTELLLEATLGREAALREELAALRESYEAMRDRKNSIVDLQQRLTVAEQRETELIGLLKLSLLAVDDVAENCEDQADWATANSMHALSKRITAALKPAEGEGS